MPLLGQMFRSAAIYGDTNTIGARIAGRQGGRWAQQTVSAAMPHATYRRQAPGPPPAAATRQPDAIASLRALGELHSQGVVTDAEFSALKRRLGF